MRIGIDFDNTIVNTSVTSKRYLDKHLPGNNLNSYHDLSKNEGLDFFYKYYKDITNSLDLFEVLEGLGYKTSEINKVIKNVDSFLSVEMQVKEALKLLLR